MNVPNSPKEIWVFTELPQKVNNLFYWQTSKQLADEYINHLINLYKQTIQDPYKLTRHKTDKECVWILIDCCNGNCTSKYYLWMFSSKKRSNEKVSIS